MSLVCTLTGVILMLVPGLDPTTKGVGASLVITVQGYWFVAGSAKQVASEVVSQMNQNISSSPSVLTVTQPAPILTVTHPPADTPS
jgi:hypothetical protein